MNCHDCQQRLQARLDGEAVPGDDIASHLAACPECRSLAAAARRLQAGLALLAAPVPPPGLGARLAVGVLADRRRRRVRRLVFAGGAALAASLLLAVFALSGEEKPSDWAGERWASVKGYWSPPRTPSSDCLKDIHLANPPAPETTPPPSLDDNVAEATSAVAALARRTAGETVGNGQVLVPAVSLPMPTEDVLGPPLEPPAESLREAGHGVATGLQPVAAGAQRWFSLIQRDMTSVTPEGKPGF